MEECGRVKRSLGGVGGLSSRKGVGMRENPGGVWVPGRRLGAPKGALPVCLCKGA